MATQAADDAIARATTLKALGNEHAEASRPSQAANCYREALNLLTPVLTAGRGDKATMALLQVVRLNLALCILQSEDLPEEAVQLCSGVLEAEPECTKALFRRGLARWTIARSDSTDLLTKKEALLDARRDLSRAAELESSDPKIRDTLKQVVQKLEELGGGGGGGREIRGAFGKLYPDRPSHSAAAAAAAAQSPVVVCRVCGRPGHEECGKSFWLSVRAAWLGVPIEKVAQEPRSFEDDGTLREVILEDRRSRAARDPSGRQPGILDYNSDGELPELGEDECELLEECLESVERPYPLLYRPLPLPQAVRAAVDIWAEDS